MSFSPSTLHSQSPVRLVLSASAYVAVSTLETFITDDVLAKHCQVAGILFDDPANPVCNANNRTWRYLDTKELPYRVERLAHEHGIPTFSGDIHSNEFRRTFLFDWKPDLIVSCFYGQKLPDEFLVVPKLGAINAHPCLRNPFFDWPSDFAGTFAINRILAAGHSNLHWAAHYMTQEFDSGPPIAWSPSVDVSQADSTATTYEKQATHVAKFLADVVSVLIGKRHLQEVRPPLGFADFGSFKNRDQLLAANPYLAVRLALANAHQPYSGFFFLSQNDTAMKLNSEPSGFLAWYLAKEGDLPEGLRMHACNQTMERRDV